MAAVASHDVVAALKTVANQVQQAITKSGAKQSVRNQLVIIESFTLAKLYPSYVYYVYDYHRSVFLL